MNRAPVTILSGLALPSIEEDVLPADNRGDEVGELASMIGTDSDDPTLGLAITQSDQTNGVWQYRSQGDSIWMEFPSIIGEDEALQINSTSSVRFVPDEHYFGQSQFTALVWDMTNDNINNSVVDIGSSDEYIGAYSSSSATLTISITHVNDPPEIILSVSEVTYTEASSAVQLFPNLAITDIDNVELQSATIILDCPSCSSPLQDQENDGLLTFSGMSFDSRSRDMILSQNSAIPFRIEMITNDSLQSEFRITPIAPEDHSISSFNRYLQSLHFANNDPEPMIQPRIVSLSVNDGVNSSNSVMVTVMIELVNDESPVVMLPFPSFTYVEDSGQVDLFDLNSGPVVSDLDQIYPLLSATVQLSATDLESEVIMVNCTAYSQLTCISSGDTITITGMGTLMEYSSVLGSLSYGNFEDEPSTDPRVISFVVFDGIFYSSNVSLEILTQLINDQLPILTPETSNINFLEQNPTSPPLSLNVGIIVTDPDNGQFPLASIRAILVDPQDPENERIGFSRNFNFPPFIEINASDPNQVSISVREDAVNMNGDPLTGLSPNDVQRFLQGLTYFNRAVQPSGDGRMVSIIASDNLTLTGIQESEPAVIVIDFEFVDDVPEIELNNTIITYSEGQTSQEVAVAPNAMIIDVDNLNISGAIIELISLNGSDLSQDILRVNLPQDGSIDLNETSSSQLIYLMGEASIETYSLVIRSLTYEHLTRFGDPEAGSRLVRVTPIATTGVLGVSDEVTVVFSAVDNPPLLDLNGMGSPGRDYFVVFEEESLPVNLTSRDLILDDVDSLELSYIQISLSVGDSTDSELIFINSVSSGSVMFDQESNTSIRLIGPASIEDFRYLLLLLQYVNEENEPSVGRRIVSVTVSDGNGETEANVFIDIELLNDAPSIFLNGVELDNQVNFTEDGSPVSLSLNPIVLDSDSEIAQLRIRPVFAQEGDMIFSTDIDLYFNTIFSYFLANFSSSSPSTVAQLISSVVYVNNLPEPESGDRIYCFSVVDDQSLPSGEACSRVIIAFINDNAPLFQQSLYVAEITENRPNADVILVTATDSDSSNTQVLLSYSIIAGDDCTSSMVSGSGSGDLMSSSQPCRFTIDPSSGQISTTDSALDRELRSSYSLTVVASDGELEGRTIVNITIIDESDVAPTFQPMFYSVTVPQGAEANFVLVEVSIVDPDIDDRINIFLELMDPTRRDVFSVSTSGAISLSIPESQLDPTVPQYILSLNAVDSGFNLATNLAVVEVNVTLNNVEPIFDEPSYTASVSEAAVIGTNVVRVSATDADSGSNAEITYSIVSSSTPVPFSINSSSGYITLTGSLDYETTQSYDLTVTASDSGRPMRSASVPVTILIININEDTPTFNQVQYAATICEGTPVGYEILTIVAEDDDAGSLGEVTYTVVDEGNSMGRIRVDGTTGAVVVAALINFEDQFTSFVVSVLAVDGGGLSSTEAEIEISVFNDNEYPPMFQSNSFNVTIPENYPVGSPLPLMGVSGSLASDSDACNVDQCDGSVVISNATCTSASSLTYTILSGNELGLFGIDSLTGIVSLVNELDFDERGHMFFSLLLLVDDGQFISNATFQVNVTDFNDNLPVFQNSSYSIEIAENTEIGTLILTVLATDIDPTSIIVYSLAGEDSDDFSINANTGAVSTATSLHFQTIPAYNLMVFASNPDMGMGDGVTVAVSLTIVIIDVNDNPPMFSEPSYIFYLPENNQRARIGRVIATDMDSGFNALIEFFITDVSPGNLSLFSINASSGVIYAEFSFDREVIDEYVLTIEARDGGVISLSSSAQVIVEITDVNDNAPVISPDKYNVSIDENVPLNSELVIVNATDPDNLETDLLFDIIDGNNLGHFMIDNSGIIFVVSELDREAVEEYTLQIRVADSPELSLTSLATVYVTVNDINDNLPSFSLEQFTASLPEDIPDIPPYTVTTITATDADVGSNAEIIYTFTGSNLLLPFEIDPISGLVTVSRASDIDRETAESYDIEVMASNPDGMFSVTSLIIYVTDVNDNAPVFTEEIFSASVMEDFTPVSDNCTDLSSLPGSGSGLGADIMNRYITTVTASDRDESNTPNSQITYSLLAVLPPGNFIIDPISGDVYAAQPLDRECFGSYHLRVQASDGGSLPLTSMASINVSITDVNDNSPEFEEESFAVAVSESIIPGTSFFQVIASDLDIGVNAQLRYSLGLNSTPFVIEQNSGRIYASSSLDRETVALYLLEVTVSDSGSPPLSANASVEILLEDANDNPPILMPSSFSGQLDENLPNGTVVASFVVTDADIGENAMSNLSLIGQSSSFSIIDGDLVVSGILDFETKNETRFNVIARNLEFPFWDAIAPVVITLNNINDNAPIVIFGNPQVAYFERNKQLILNVDAIIVDDDGRDFTQLTDGLVELDNVDPREPSEPFIPNINDPFLPYNCPLEDDKERKFGPCNLPVLADHFFTRPSRDLTTRNLNEDDLKSDTIIFDASLEQYAYSSIDRSFMETGMTISSWIWFEPILGGSSPMTVISKSSISEVLYSLYCSSDGQNLGFQYRNEEGEKRIEFQGACSQIQGAWNHLGVVLDNSNPSQWVVTVYINSELYSSQNISFPVDGDGSIFVGTVPSGGVNAPRTNFFSGRLHLLLISYSIANQNEINCAIGCGVAIISSLESTPFSYRYDYLQRTLFFEGREPVEIYEEFLNSLVMILPLIEPVSSSYSVNYTVQDEIFNCIPRLIIIELHAVNDFPPAFSLNGQISPNFTATFTEEAGPISALNSTSFFLTDRDLVAFVYTIVVRIENPQPLDSDEVLEITTNLFQGMNVTFSNYTLTLTGELPLPMFEDVLRTITYNNLDDEPIGNSRLLRFTVSDPPEDDISAFSLIDIVLVNDLPVLMVEFVTNEYSEGDGAIQFIRNVEIEDSDNATLTSGRITFNIRDPGFEVLSVNTSNSDITSDYDSVTGVLTLTGEDTLASYEAVLQSLSYEHINMDNPTPATRTFNLTISDGLSENFDVAMLFFSVVNDPPIFDLNGPQAGSNYSVTFVEDRVTSVAAVSPQAVLIDVDNIDIFNISITLSQVLDGSNEILVVDIPQNDGSTNQITGLDLIITGIFPTSIYQDIVRSLQYQNLAEEPIPGVRMIQFSAHDGMDESPLAFTLVTVQSGNDVPLLDLDALSTTPGYQTVFEEQGTPVFITSRNVTITDNDDGARVSMVEVIIHNAIDNLSERVTSTDRSVNITDFFTVSSNSFVISPLDDSLEAVEELLTTLQYSNSRDEPSEGTRNISVSISDGISPSNIEFVLLDLISVNENPPQFLQSRYSRAIMEELDPEVSVAAVQAIDADSGSDGEVVYGIVSSSPLEGGNSFRIDSDGIIYTTTVLDRESIDFYVLNISASDGGNPPRVDYATVEISVLDINDQIPVFRQETLFNLSVSEGSSVGFNIGVIQATDRDSGENAMITYSLIGSSSKFNILPNGYIEVSGPLDADFQDPECTITVMASDNGTIPLTSEANITITVLDINDNRPVFNNSIYSGEIIENTPPGTSILTVSASDSDSGTNTQISFFLGTSDDLTESSPHFSIDDTGIITNTQSFDREGSEFIDTQLFVSATDNGLPRLSNTGIVSVTITITDANDMSPTFTRSSYTATIDENIPTGSSVLSVTATDGDLDNNAQIIYSIVPNSQIMPLFASNPFFSIDPSSGEIFVNEEIDYELHPTIIFTVRATDLGSPPQTGEANVTVSIQDLNDNEPEFSESLYQVSVAEDVPVGTTVLTVLASDADSNQNGDVTYTLIDNTDSFMIDQATGVIFNVISLDFESDCFYTLLIIASDNGSPQLNSTAGAYISLLPVHDVPPSFSMTSYSRSVVENMEIGSSIFQVSATDGNIFSCSESEILNSSGSGEPDLSPSTDELLSMNNFEYLLLNHNDDFIINNSTGLITNTVQLDRERVAQYVLTVEARDPEGLTAQVSVTINILDLNDNLPEFAQSFYSTVMSENVEIGTTVLRVTATDADSIDRGRLTYSLVNDFFSINNRTGAIFISRQIDFDVIGDSIDLVPMVTDTADQSTVVLVRIIITDLNDIPPSITTPPRALNFTEGQVSLIPFPEISINDSDSFQFLCNATITLNTPQNRNIETECMCSSDSDTPLCSPGCYEFIQLTSGSFPGLVLQSENGTVLTLIGNYSIMTYESAIRSVQYINMVSNPIPGSRAISLYVSDCLLPSNIFMNTIDILALNVFPPFVDLNGPSQSGNNFTASFSERGPQVAVASPDAIITDEDMIREREELTRLDIWISNPQDGDAESLVISEVFSPAITMIRNSPHSINFSGIALLSEYTSILRQVMYDNQADEPVPSPERRVYVVAQEFHLSSSPAVTTIQFITSNDHPPVIQTSPPLTNGMMSFREGTPGMPITSSDAFISDPDSTEDFISTMEANILAPSRYDRIYLLETIAVPSAISVSRQSNSSILFSGLAPRSDYDIIIRGLMYQFVGEEFDAIFPPKFVYLQVMDSVYSTFSAVQITLVPINDQSPFFTETNFTAEISEDASVGYSVVQVTAVDGDRFSDNNIAYSIQVGSDEDLFTISPVNGSIFLSRSLNFETVRTHRFIVEVRDLNLIDTVPISLSTAVVIINVVDVNDQVPMFDTREYNATIGESVPIGTLVLRVSASDQDSELHSQLEFDLVNMTDFIIDNRTGMIFTSAELDREMISFYSFFVSVRNPGSSAFDTARVNITVLDLDDNPPILILDPDTNILQEPDTYVPLAINLDIVDLDPNPSLDFAIVQIQPSNGVAIGELHALVNSPLIAVSGNGSSMLVFTGESQPLSEYVEVLRGVAYQDLSSEPIGMNRVIAYQVGSSPASSQPLQLQNMGDMISDVTNFTVMVSLINDNPPELSLDSRPQNQTDLVLPACDGVLGSFSTNYNEDTPPVSLSHSSLGISDDDSGDNIIAYAVIQIINPQDSGLERISIDLPITSTLSVSSSNLTIVLSGPAPLGEYESALKLMK